MLGSRDLILCSGTLLGVSPREKIRAASAAGFAGVTMWAEDYQGLRDEGLSDPDIRALLRDHGLEVGEIDPLVNWLPGSEPDASAPEMARGMYSRTLEDLCAIARAVGARSLNLVEVFGKGAPVDVAAEAFAKACDRAAEDGLLVHLEFMPWGGFPNLESAWDVARTAARPNGGINVDVWHFVRSHSSLDLLATLPSNAVLGVQLDDVAPEPLDDMIHETLEARRLPGEGAADLVGLIRTLDAIGCTAPFSVEVFSADLRKLPPVDAARRAAETTRAVLAKARG